MANELLRFKKGLYENLNKQAMVPGTVYVTTDEGAMYVDLTAERRVRISSIVSYQSFESFKEQVKPPYNPEAFYYIIDDNALFKYNEEAKTWQQINSVSDVQANLTELETAVAGLTSSLGTTNENLTKLTERVTTAEGEIDVLQTEMDAVEKAASDNATALTTLESRVKANEENIEAAQEDISGINSNVEGLTTRVSNLETADSAQDTLISGLRADLGVKPEGNDSTAFERIAAVESKAGANEIAISSANAKIAALETTSADHTSSINSINGEITTIKGEATALASRVATAESSINDHSTRLTAVEAKANENATTIGTQGTRLAAAEEDIATNKSGIAANKANIESNDADILALQNRATAVEERVDQAEKDIEALEKAVGIGGTGESLTSRLAAAEATILQHTDDISANTSAINDINTVIGADDSAGLRKRIKDNETNIAQLRTDLTATNNTVSDVSTVANRADSASQTNTAAIKTINETLGSHNSKIEDLEQNKVNKSDYATDKAALEKQITDSINAANAMEYQGTVSTLAALNALTDLKIGDTYIATGDFVYNSADIRTGDLLIARGTEVDGIITSNLGWDIVNTGYIYDQNPTMSVADNTINLTAYAGTTGDKGKVTFEGAGAVNVATADNKMTVSVVWEDFV